MIKLGIHAAFHDSAAARVRDCELIAADEEQRFTRIEHAKRPLPFPARRRCALYHGEFRAIGR
jgi:carbamoyltransferase